MSVLELDEKNDINKSSSLIDFFTSCLHFLVISSATGATVACLMHIIPVKFQVIIISLINLDANILPPCQTVNDYVIGTAGGVMWNKFSCSYRAVQFEKAVEKLIALLGLLIGFTLRDSIKENLKIFFDSF
jgi:hypothetical protein